MHFKILSNRPINDQLTSRRTLAQKLGKNLMPEQLSIIDHVNKLFFQFGTQFGTPYHEFVSSKTQCGYFEPTLLEQLWRNGVLGFGWSHLPSDSSSSAASQFGGPTNDINYPPCKRFSEEELVFSLVPTNDKNRAFYSNAGASFFPNLDLNLVSSNFKECTGFLVFRPGIGLDSFYFFHYKPESPDNHYSKILASPADEEEILIIRGDLSMCNRDNVSTYLPGLNPEHIVGELVVPSGGHHFSVFLESSNRTLTIEREFSNFGDAGFNRQYFQDRFNLSDLMPFQPTKR